MILENFSFPLEKIVIAFPTFQKRILLNEIDHPYKWQKYITVTPNDCHRVEIYRPLDCLIKHYWSWKQSNHQSFTGILRIYLNPYDESDIWVLL